MPAAVHPHLLAPTEMDEIDEINISMATARRTRTEREAGRVVWDTRFGYLPIVNG